MFESNAAYTTTKSLISWLLSVFNKSVKFTLHKPRKMVINIPVVIRYVQVRVMAPTRAICTEYTSLHMFAIPSSNSCITHKVAGKQG